ncbi:MAG: FAD-dependent oxidoreductase [Bryobacterales bacterium]|nr:FAD-dependent oxidoreductase [Bryobacterales bacterium]
MKIAVVGAGISGMVCASLLSRAHEVVVLEAAPRIGGHTHTIAVERNGGSLAIDSGFIVFNHAYYPNFTRLLEILGVESQPAPMSLSVRCDRTGLEYAGASLNSLFAQRSNLARPAFWRLLRDILRFQKEGVAALATLDDQTTVAAFVREGHYSDEFLRYFIVPMGSALWSSPAGDFLRFPVRFIIEFFANHGMMQILGRPSWRVVRGGSARYMEKLVDSFRGLVRTGTPVQAIERHAAGVTVKHSGVEEVFDHAILACHSDEALAMLGPAATRAEREILGHFPYQANDTVLHTDVRVLPRNRRAWGCWNYHVARDLERSAAVTYNMNLLQSLPTARETYCVSLNESGIDPARVIRRMTYHHPVYRPGRQAMQARHPELIGPNRTSFCGAYWGFGFHEDGVRSALAVCRHFGAELG